MATEDGGIKEELIKNRHTFETVEMGLAIGVSAMDEE